MDLLIRQAKKDDQERLGTLWLALLHEQAALDDRLGVADDALERWSNDFPFWLPDESRRFFVAEQRGVVVGFVTAQSWSPAPIFAEALEAYISELYVVPEVRQQHAGAGLVAAVLAWAETLGAHRLRLSVLAANELGQAFWQRQHAEPFSITYTIALDQKQKASSPTSRRIGF